MIENFKIDVFRVMAETLNFNQTSEEIHLSESAITPHFRGLDEALGIALFDRTECRATLTPSRVLRGS